MTHAGAGGRPRWSAKALTAVLCLSGASLMVSVFYSAMLGFGVNERCSSRFLGPEYCERLDWMATGHAGVQMVLVAAAVLVATKQRTQAQWDRWGSGTTVVVVSYLVLALTATVVYTHAAWDWANGGGL